MWTLKLLAYNKILIHNKKFCIYGDLDTFANTEQVKSLEKKDMKVTYLLQILYSFSKYREYFVQVV